MNAGGEMNPVESPARQGGRASRARRSKGSELVEFMLVLLPLLAMVTVLVDTAWAIFAESTLQRAVRIGVRTGVTLTASQVAAGGNLTATVKSIVRANALGLLNGSNGTLLVNYYQPPDPGSNAPATDVAASPTGDQGGNIMKVTVQDFYLTPLVPRIFSLRAGGVDNSKLLISVNAADIIEPSRNPPPIGPAP